MTPSNPKWRASLAVIVALMAVGSAWAATVKRYVTIVTLTDDIEFIIRQTGSGNVVFSDINAQTQRTLTKDEAASLGRALLEAAGEPGPTMPKAECDDLIRFFSNGGKP